MQKGKVNFKILVGILQGKRYVGVGCMIILIGIFFRWGLSMAMLFLWVLTPSVALKKERVCLSETLVSSYESTRHHNPEEQHCHPLYRENPNIT
jgi:hypothetical protein